MFEIVAGELHAKLRSSAAMCARAEAGLWGRGGARPGFEATRRATDQHTRHCRCGGRRRDRRARLRRPWAAAGPGRASRRRAEQHISDQAPPVWRAPEGPEGTGGLRGAAPNEVRPPSLAGGRGLRRPKHQRRHKQHHAAAGDLSGHSNTEDQANLPYSPPPGSGRPV